MPDSMKKKLAIGYFSRHVKDRTVFSFSRLFDICAGKCSQYDLFFARDYTLPKFIEGSMKTLMFFHPLLHLENNVEYNKFPKSNIKIK